MNRTMNRKMNRMLKIGWVLLGLIVLAMIVVVLRSSGGGQKVDDSGGIRYHHDSGHAVSCWTYYGPAISCLPDSQVRSP
jgi:hypothetical protein